MIKNPNVFARPASIHDGRKIQYQDGITLRDHIAITVLPALINRGNLTVDEICAIAYRYGDAMLEERLKEK